MKNIFQCPCGGTIDCYPNSKNKDMCNSVWIYINHKNDIILKSSLELISAGKTVAKNLKQKLIVVVAGYKIEKILHELLKYDVDEILYFDDLKLKNYLCLPYTTVITNIIEERKPYVFLFVADEVGRDLAPRIACRIRTGLATDNIDLKIEDFYSPFVKKDFKSLLIQVRPDFATRIARIYTPMHRPQIATVRPGNYPIPEIKNSKNIIKTKCEAKFQKSDFTLILKEIKEIQAKKSNLETSRVVISIGLGILQDNKGNPINPKKGYELAQELAKAINEKFGWDTSIGSSRALIYAHLKELEGVITLENQVGQTGTTVSPDIYFALGISGAVQHRVGMQKSKKIIAVNNDPEAPIFDIAHYPIVGDIYDEVPKLIDTIRSSK